MKIMNKSGFEITLIQIDEHGESIKIKLESPHEHRYLEANGYQTIWQSAEQKRAKENGDNLVLPTKLNWMLQLKDIANNIDTLSEVEQEEIREFIGSILLGIS